MKSLECQICFHEFDECRRRPRILSCGHTFCSICLKSLLKDRKITCPNCKKYHVAENVENININFILEKFLNPDEESNNVAVDIGYKCKEHCYEQNFFCQTHEEWICRDCTVIKHKPCSHSENCDNENDCKVYTKVEKLDKIKSDKKEKLNRNFMSYGTILIWLINQYNSRVNSKIALREDLQKRLKKFAEENEFEIQELRKKLDSSEDIRSNVLKHMDLIDLAEAEMMEANGRFAVEESCKNLDKKLTSTVEWAEKEKFKIKEDMKSIADVEINLKEFEGLKQTICELEFSLSDSVNVVKDLNFKIAEHESTNNHLQSELKESKEKVSELQEQYFDTIVRMNSYKKQILELEEKLDNSNSECDSYRKKMESLEKKLSSSVKNCEKCAKYMKNSKIGVIETRNLLEIKDHLLGWHKDAYLFTRLLNEKGAYENYYGELNLSSLRGRDIVVVDAFQKDFSPGSLILECPSIIPRLEPAEYVYLEIGKMEIYRNYRGKMSSRPLGRPFGRLLIALSTTPRRKHQMLALCGSINSVELKHCNFSVIKNKDRPGELVTCTQYNKIVYDKGQNCAYTEKRDVLNTYLENLDESIPIKAGNVFGYFDGGVRFSIITRDNYSRDTRWPFLGKVVSGLHYLQDAVRNHDVETIGIHSHGIGFPTIPLDIFSPAFRTLFDDIFT